MPLIQHEPITDRTLRVLCVITAMGCGGAERQMAWLVNRLAENGHRVAFRVLYGNESFFENCQLNPLKTPFMAVLQAKRSR